MKNDKVVVINSDSYSWIKNVVFIILTYVKLVIK